MDISLNNANYLGEFNGERSAWLPLDDRRRHILITGTTGTGKSTLLANLFAQEAEAGRGVLLIDPHGSLAQKALDLVPARRVNKTIYIDPSDTEHPVGFNVLYNVPRHQRATRAAEVVAAIEAIWGDNSWGPRLQHILYNAIAALLDVGDATLLGIRRMLQDEKYRERIKAHIQDRQVKNFWDVTFNDYLEEGQQVFASVINKVDQMTASPVVRNIIGQPMSTFDPRHLMDNDYLVIVNLSKGLLGDEHANLLGSLLIAAFGSAAMARASLPAEAYRDFSIIVDEFQSYTTNKFASMLSEVRKYNVSLVLSHQYLDQLSIPVRAAALGNVGSLIVFRVGGADAKVFGTHMPELPYEHFADTLNYRAQARIMAFGFPGQTAELHTPGEPRRRGKRKSVLKFSRDKFGRSRAAVESRIDRFLDAQPARRAIPKRRTRF